MGDMCDKINVFSSSTSGPAIPQAVSATDEMSLLLQQILVGSSSSSLRSSVTGLFGSDASPALGDGILAADASLSANTNRAIGGHFVQTSSVGPSENDNDEYDCESEDGLVALAEEMPDKTSIRRGSSKRSRAAEVHNLSEKRRRSKINEKMKALQNLIPNSNKTDKASMLDEAIEYLKQLQLQVQMLAMRNGLSLYPVSLPGGLHPAELTKMIMDMTKDNRSLQSNLPGELPFHQQTASTQNLFPPPNQCSSSNQQVASDILNTADSETTIRLETPMLPHHAAFQLQSSAQDICKGNRMINQQTNAKNLGTSHLEFGEQAAATLANFNRQPSGIKGNSSLETCLVEGDWSENLLRKAIEQSLILPSDLNR